MVVESKTISRFVFQICLSNRKKKKNPPYFDAVQKLEAVSTPFVFLDFFQPHLFIFY